MATCPDSGILVEGTPCSSSGLLCQGNPAQCRGATFFDTLRCDGSLFVTVVASVCTSDAGADGATEHD